jgi:flagellin
MGQSTHSLGEDMAKLSSGYRINKAADDAAGLAISESMKAKIRSLDQAKRNANDGVSLIQVAEGGMNEVSNILIRLRELATQAATDTIGNTERSYTNKEYVQLVNEIQRISNTTEFNGAKLLAGQEAVGDGTMFNIHVGVGDGLIENTDTLRIGVEDLTITTEKLGLGTEAEIGPMSPEDGFSRETAAAKLTVIDSALENVASSRAYLGAQQSRLGSTINNLGIQIENMKSANSRIRDVDFAEVTASFTQNRILQQAGASVLAQANQAPEIALSLLR